jgi:hypothetical protein
MKKLIAIALLVASGVAAASCPTYAPYRCQVMMNGKQICGCGM